MLNCNDLAGAILMGQAQFLKYHYIILQGILCTIGCDVEQRQECRGVGNGECSCHLGRGLDFSSAKEIIPTGILKLI